MRCRYRGRAVDSLGDAGRSCLPTVDVGGVSLGDLPVRVLLLYSLHLEAKFIIVVTLALQVAACRASARVPGRQGGLGDHRVPGIVLGRHSSNSENVQEPELWDGGPSERSGRQGVRVAELYTSHRTVVN